MLTTGRRILAALISVSSVTLVTPVLVPPAFAAASGTGCQSLIGCAMQSGQVPYGLSAADVPGTDAEVGAPLPGGCQSLPGTVPPAERGNQTPPPDVPGDWAYQVCGDPADVADAVATGSAAAARSYCETRQCTVLVIWRPADPNYREHIPTVGGPDGWEQYFTLAPVPASSPMGGRVFVTLPTWFYDTNHLGLTGAAVPAFGLTAGVAYLKRTWWDVDGHQICGRVGTRPPSQMSASEAAGPSPDCGYTFTSVGHHGANVHKKWVIVVAGFFGAVTYSVTYHRHVSVTAREVQALGS
ncbi:MAG: hypothetical protein HYR62_00350 [Actinobacteria bacterium]|nr:hypothetical protein [Actinomycetota bacterium]MBI3687813.1 hypothetical protein [Actinomycetota bacterium]